MENKNVINQNHKNDDVTYDIIFGFHFTGNKPSLTGVQKIIDNQIKTYGYVGARMYDQLDEIHLFLDHRNRVQYQ